jgi:hypothetical protein
VTVVRGPEDLCFGRHPTPADVALLVEVADTSLRQDRDVKGPIYARARVAVYWIVNLPERCVEVYSDPPRRRTKAGYRRRAVYAVGEAVPLVLGGQEFGPIPVGELLPG